MEFEDKTFEEVKERLNYLREWEPCAYNLTFNEAYLGKIRNTFNTYKFLLEKVGFKSILMQALRKLGLEEILNNEVIITNLTILFTQDNQDYMPGIACDCDYYTDTMINEAANVLFNDIYEKIKQILFIQKDNKYIRVCIKKINNDYFVNSTFEELIKDTYRRYKPNYKLYECQLSANEFIYDKESHNTTYVKTNANYEFRYDSGEDMLIVCSEKTEEEYDQNFNMISDVVFNNSYKKTIENESSLENITLVDNNNWFNRSSLKVGLDKSMVHYTYEEKGYDRVELDVPTKYETQVIDYFRGCETIENLNNYNPDSIYSMYDEYLEAEFGETIYYFIIEEPETLINKQNKFAYSRIKCFDTENMIQNIMTYKEQEMAKQYIKKKFN